MCKPKVSGYPIKQLPLRTLVKVDLVSQRFPNGDIIMLPTGKSCLCPFKGWGGGEARIVPLPGKKGAVLIFQMEGLASGDLGSSTDASAGLPEPQKT